MTPFAVDICQKVHRKRCFYIFFAKKSWSISDNLLPLHSIIVKLLSKSKISDNDNKEDEKDENTKETDAREHADARGRYHDVCRREQCHQRG
jgi:hypothetical protein